MVNAGVAVPRCSMYKGEQGCGSTMGWYGCSNYVWAVAFSCGHNAVLLQVFL